LDNRIPQLATVVEPALYPFEDGATLGPPVAGEERANVHAGVKQQNGSREYDNTMWNE
jgi:hypothetical protein